MNKLKCELCNKDFKNHDALNMHNSSKHHGNKTNKSSKKMIYIGVAALLLILLVLFFVMKSNSTQINGSSDSNVQKVTLSFGSNYAPSTINVKAGTPVEITLDDSVSGCFRAFRIPELKFFKISTSPSDKITFTPDKPGIYRFQCSMNMGYGTLVVS